MGIIKKVTNALHNHKTYRVGLLQAKAYRILKQKTSKLLEKHGISSVEWAFLGFVYDSKDGVRMAKAAEELGVEAPFITQMMNSLKKHNFILQKSDPDDTRAKLAYLTSAGKKFVEGTEAFLRDGMRPLLYGVSPRDIIGYLAVLERINKNGKH